MSRQYKKYFYFIKHNNQCVYLTPRQNQCLWLYHQHRNIKTVSTQVGISHRTIEEYLMLIRKKFQFRKTNELMNALDNHLIEFVDKQ